MKQNSELVRLLSPTWVVSFVGLTLAILVTGSAITLSQYRGSELSRQIFEVRSGGGVANSTYDSVTTYVGDNSFLNALPLLLVWAAIGLVVYFFAVALVRSMSQAVELRDELGYVHVSRQDRLREALKHLALRALVVIGWFLFVQITMYVLLPYALAASHIAARSFSLQSVGYVLLSVGLIYGAVWAHSIFLRLFMLRMRAIGR